MKNIELCGDLDRTELIQLHNYKDDPPLNFGLGKEKKVLKYRYEYKGENYLIEVTLDIANIIEVTIYELDDSIIKYIGDTGENVFFVFRKLILSKEELKKYINKWIDENRSLIFKSDCWTLRTLSEEVKKWRSERSD